MISPASSLLPADARGRRDQSADQMRKTAEDFEASFLSQMLKPMFEGLQTDGPFGGGEGETTWRSFLIDAMAKQAVKAGGIGLADTVMTEMLKMQEQAG
ncbi:rod-binding protein [Brevundimonas sp.]|uniref:rod-binding protein n=1 Tax=Brevundimonas sp. TaxID=1871086 RepID=UPI0028A5942E|nr:rod-binding protein [Brevundimonas sp.]